VCFFNDGSQFLSCNDIVGRDSPDRTIMIWDFSTGAVLSNQIYQVNIGRIHTCVIMIGFSQMQDVHQSVTDVFGREFYSSKSVVIILMLCCRYN